jgi:large subunit ribosomal protein L18
MKIRNEKNYKRNRRHLRVRRKIIGTPERPRLCVFRSTRYIYAQIIDDTRGHTLAAASSLKLVPSPEAGEKKTGRKLIDARTVGKAIAEAAKAKGISKVAFDRGGFRYHGRVAALASAAREAGLEF